jgi:hypothetical protein
MEYYHAVSPAPGTPQNLELLFDTICQIGVSEAFRFARLQVGTGHRTLFERLIANVLIMPQGAAKAQHSVDLINLPFSAEEEDWFESYFAQTKVRSYPGATDTFNMRMIATGRYTAAVAEGRGTSGRMVDGVSWGLLREGLKNAMGPRLTLGSPKGVTR